MGLLKKIFGKGDAESDKRMQSDIAQVESGQSHMLKAHELLGSNELLVSIPRRRCMMITSKQVDKELLSTFLALHKHAWEDESYGNAPIMNALFAVVNGEIDGVIPLNN